jgi:hypothetical protein
MDRKEAKAAGVNKYIGADCQEQHGGERYTVNGECVKCASARNKKWMRDNAEHRDAYAKAYKTENAEKITAYNNSENGKNVRLKIIATRKANGGYAYQRMVDNMRKLNRTVSWEQELTEFVGKEAHHLSKLRERVIGGKWSVDHIIPVRGKVVSGLHTWNNLQVIPMQQNRSKFNRLEV